MIVHRDCFATTDNFMVCLDNIWPNVITLTVHFLGKWENMRIFTSIYFYPEDSYIKSLINWATT